MCLVATFFEGRVDKLVHMRMCSTLSRSMLLGRLATVEIDIEQLEKRMNLVTLRKAGSASPDATGEQQTGAAAKAAGDSATR